MITADTRLCPECGAPISMPTWSECSPECSRKRLQRKLEAIAEVYADVVCAKISAQDAIAKIGDILVGGGQ